MPSVAESDIQSACLIQAGFVRYSGLQLEDRISMVADPDGDSDFLIGELDKEDVQDFSRLLRDALESSPHIYRIEKITENIGSTFSGSLVECVVECDLLRMSVGIPGRFQEPYYWNDGGEPIEEFKVILGGSLFLSYAEVDEVPTFARIGRAFSKLLIEKVNEETDIHAQTGGPPYWTPDWYLMEKAEKIDDFGSSASVSEDGASVKIETNFSPDEGVVELFKRVSQPLSRVIYCGAERSYVSMQFREIYGVFEKLGKSVQQLTDVHWWQYKKKWQIGRRARSHLTKLNRLLTNYERDSIYLAKHSENAKEALSQSRLVSHLKPALSTLMEQSGVVPDHFKSTVDFFDRQVRTLTMSRENLIAALLSALIGGLVVLLFGG